MLVMLWHLRHKLGLPDLAELFREHGFALTPDADREWEEPSAPLPTKQLRTKRRDKAGCCRSVNETSIKVHGVHGRRCDSYRAIDRDGNLVDSLLS